MTGLTPPPSFCSKGTGVGSSPWRPWRASRRSLRWRRTRRPACSCSLSAKHFGRPPPTLELHRRASGDPRASAGPCARSWTCLSARGRCDRLPRALLADVESDIASRSLWSARPSWTSPTPSPRWWTCWTVRRRARKLHVLRTRLLEQAQRPRLPLRHSARPANARQRRRPRAPRRGGTRCRRATREGPPMWPRPRKLPLHPLSTRPCVLPPRRHAPRDTRCAPRTVFR